MVEWKPLNSIVKSISTGLNPRQNFVLNDENATFYYVTVKEITSNKVVFSESTDRITEKAKLVINNRSKLSEGDILFSGIGTIGKVAYVDIPTSNWDCSESVFLIKPNDSVVKGKFLSYILSSDIAKNQYEKGAAGAIMKGVRKATLESLLIPIPSFEEQARIVRILDTFTSAIDNLKEQITQRRKQYEYYRDQLLDLEGEEIITTLSFGNDFQLKARIGWQGLTKKEYKTSGDYKLVTGTDFSGNLRIDFDSCVFVEKERYEQDEYIKLKVGDVLITKDGTLGKVAYIDKLDMPATLNGGVFVVRDPKKRVIPKFIMYYLTSDHFKKWMQQNHTTGSIQHLTQKLLSTFTIPVLSEIEQQRIVSILDTFEASIQNLEAQLKEREKQYEYYRNQLLTFE